MGPPGVVLSLNGLSFGMYMRQFCQFFGCKIITVMLPNPEKVGHTPEIIIGSGQREILSTDRIGSEETEHRDADLVRSGFQDVGNLVTARGLTSL